MEGEAPGFRCIYPPGTRNKTSWGTSVTINGKTTCAGNHATQEAAARAVDAMLLRQASN